jgi:hypothetical protein
MLNPIDKRNQEAHRWAGNRCGLVREYAKSSLGWVEEFVANHIREISKLSYREALRILWKEGCALDIVRQ